MRLSRSPIQRPIAVVLPRRRAHQRHLRIVRVEEPALVSGRHGVGRAEIDHVDRADRADIGHPRADDRAEAVVVRGEHAAHQHVGDLGRRDVDDAGQHARNRPASPSTGRRCRWRGRRGIPSPASSAFATCCTHGRGDAEHRQADCRRLGGRLRIFARCLALGETRLDHADQRLRAIRQHLARDRG